MIMTEKLNPVWKKWRRSRRSEMLRSGMPETSANNLSLAEATGRQRIARHTGVKAAKDAKLTLIRTSTEEEKIVLMVNPGKIDANDREGAFEALQPLAKTMPISLFSIRACLTGNSL